MRKRYSIKTYLCLVAIGLVWSGASNAYSSSPEKNVSKHDFFHTFSNHIPAELALAKRDNKFGAMVFFSTPHCRFCKRMKATIFNQAIVQSYFRKNFQLFEINIESKQLMTNEQNQAITISEYAGNNRVRLTPTIIFLDQKGNQAYRHVGIIADPKEFIWLGEYVITGQTQIKSFATFKMNKRRNTP